MWMDNQELETEIQSKDPRRISDALNELNTRVDDFGGSSIDFIGSSIFDCFAKPISENDAQNYLKIIFSFPLFNSEPDKRELYQQAFNVLKVTDASHYAFLLAQNLKIEDSYLEIFTEIMHGVESSEMNDFISFRVLERFLETILDGRTEIREPCIAAIRNWKATDLTKYLVQQLSPIFESS
jgi:hypothetical protein